MNKKNYLIGSVTWAALSIAVASGSPEKEPLPMVGTDAHGHAYPGATVPFGMVQLSPDTPIPGWDGCSGYHYSDSTILGFSHTHLSGTGGSCLGDVMLMPTVGQLNLDSGSPGQGYSSSFSHDQEHATPGYYSVYLKTPRVSVELTATARCGFHSYTFPATDQAHIILDLWHNVGGNETIESSIHVEDDHTLSGCRISKGWGGQRAIYYVIQFSKPFASYGIDSDGQRLEAGVREASGKQMKAFVNYRTRDREKILVKVGISGTGIDGARKNLITEIPGWDFNGVHASAVKQWREIFNAVKVKSFDPHIETTFYANLYLTALSPVLFNDVDGAYRGMDGVNHHADFNNYTTFSIWDIYRAEWPFLMMLQPHRINDMVQSMLSEYKELNQHSTPIWPLWGNETWCMIGYHSADMIASAYREGFRGFDAEIAYQAIRDTAMQDRNGLATYKTLGYVASQPGAQATSCTIEYTFNDWCIAQMAESLGHTNDAAMFLKRSANYVNLFDGNTQFFRGRKKDGSWRYPFIANALVNDEYTEADAWQYAFAVQQDVPGMIALYGGDQGFIQKLDSLFEADSLIQTTIPDISGLIGQYSQGDEQCHHVAYLYNYAGAPYKTQQHVRQAMSLEYNDTPSGQCGNIDCGQMAAWYVFSSMGIYPVNPNCGVFAIGSPSLSEATMNLKSDRYGSRTFKVIAKNNSAKNIYIQSATLNGKPLDRAWLRNEEITGGGTLRLVMGPKPNINWGSAKTSRPPATMPANFEYPKLPPPSSGNQMIEKLEVLSLPIRVSCGSLEAFNNYVPYPNSAPGSLNHTDKKIDTQFPHAAPEAVYQTEMWWNDMTFSFPVPKDDRYLVRLHFAEIFDEGVGRRLQDIAINGKSYLKSFDIFKESGGMNKAIVKEFKDIEADEHGKISVRITATPGSPDNDAKISGIEILTANSTAE